MKKIGKFNLIQKTVCTQGCRCGWNIQIGGEDTADLVKILEYLENYDKE